MGLFNYRYKFSSPEQEYRVQLWIQKLYKIIVYAMLAWSLQPVVLQTGFLLMWSIYFRNGAEVTGCIRMDSSSGFSLKAVESPALCNGQWLEWNRGTEPNNGTSLRTITWLDDATTSGIGKALTLKYAVYISDERYLENFQTFWGLKLILLLIAIFRIYSASRVGRIVFGKVELGPKTKDPVPLNERRREFFAYWNLYSVLMLLERFLNEEGRFLPEEQIVTKHFVDYWLDVWVSLAVSILLTKLYIGCVLKGTCKYSEQKIRPNMI